MDKSGYMLLADDYETTWNDGRKVTVSPSGNITDTEGNTNQKNPIYGIAIIGIVLASLYLITKKQE